MTKFQDDAQATRGASSPEPRNVASPAQESVHGATTSSEAALLTFIGTLPPPVTGNTAMNAVIVEALQRRGAVRTINWSQGKTLTRWHWRAARVWEATKTLGKLLATGRVANSPLYCTASHGAGLSYDLVIIGLAKALGYRIALQHHAYTYIDRRDWRMAWIAKRVDAHVVHCAIMREDFLRRYDAPGEFLFVPPTIVSQQLPPLPPATRSGFALGFLSNVTFAKGIVEAVETFSKINEAGRDVRLIIGGPCPSRKVQKFIDDSVERFGDRIDYRGPVYGSAKAQFFADIDALIFPTRYQAESWGIVLTEALAAGKPVLTRSRGCIPWIVDATCGLVVAPDDDFVEPASQLASSWIDSPQLLEQAREGARRRFAKLERDAQRELPVFVEYIFGWGAGSPSPSCPSSNYPP